MEFNIKELLDFFDDKKDSKKGDANALMGMFGEDINVAAYKHFRKNKEVKILEESVVQGFRGGKQLDRWVLDKNSNRLFQCEIKNWAATAIGGKSLRSDADEGETKRVVEYYWKNQLNGELSVKVKHPSKCSKVLLKMRLPEEHKTLTVKPLLIYWMPISKNGLNPLSAVSVKNLGLPIETEFSELNIFSVSLYLRQLYKKGNGQKTIDLDMPHLEHRIKILNKLKISK